MTGKLKAAVEVCVRDQPRQRERAVVELNVRADPVHLVVRVAPKVRIAAYRGRLKGKAAIRLFSVFGDLRRRPYWGNRFWVEGYCVATVGLAEDKIRKDVKQQERQERRQEELRFGQEINDWGQRTARPLWGPGRWPLTEATSPYHALWAWILYLGEKRRVIRAQAM